MNTTIMLFLVQDGITNGAIYALLGLALVLVFAVTRVILIPQGEFVTYGALTYASLAAGQMPGTAKLALALGIGAFGFDLFVARKALHGRLVLRSLVTNIVLPAIVLALTLYFAAQKPPVAICMSTGNDNTRATSDRILPTTSPDGLTSGKSDRSTWAADRISSDHSRARTSNAIVRAARE